MSSHDMKNPNGGVNMRHVTEQPDPNDHLLERILSRENMLRAWKRVKANKGAAGVDGISIAEVPGFIRDRWEDIRKSLLEGSYQPLPVLRVEIPKPDGGVRPLGIPTVLDRLIQSRLWRCWLRYLIRPFLSSAMDSDLEDRPMMLSKRYEGISVRDTV